MVCGILEVLEHCFTLHSHSNTGINADTHRSTAMNLATTLLTLPTPVLLQMHTKSLLAALHSSRQAYHNYKVNLICSKFLLLYFNIIWC